MLKKLDAKLTDLNKEIIKKEQLKRFLSKEEQHIIDNEIKEIYLDMKDLLNKIKYIKEV